MHPRSIRNIPLQQLENLATQKSKIDYNLRIKGITTLETITKTLSNPEESNTLISDTSNSNSRRLPLHRSNFAPLRQPSEAITAEESGSDNTRRKESRNKEIEAVTQRVLVTRYEL
ncbi:hypothetical protein ACFX1X_024371 [Malus domestica]